MNHTIPLSLMAVAFATGSPATDVAALQDSTAAVRTDTPTASNPFSGFETHFLANGVKIWFKHLPNAPNVSVSVGIPYGADDDPVGLEEIAHFTEHMLFSDHRGMTEQEIKDAVEGLGGRRNAFTTSDHSWYYVTIAKEHGLLAVEWLAHLMEPHAMEASVVDRNREPVALEINARPRQLGEHLLALLNPGWLRLPDYWSREFGMETRTARRYDRWARLQSITPGDLRNFYDTHYVPSKMTVTVVGDLDRDEVLDLAQATFGALLPREATIEVPATHDPGRPRSTYSWRFRSHVFFDQRIKLFQPDAQDILYLEFMSELLGRRLNRRLRHGERKAVYGISVSLIQRGPVAFFQIRGSIDVDDLDFAQGVIREELESLSTAGRSAEDFEADRTAIVERLRSESSTAESINLWSYRRFYDPDVFRDFPDLLSFFQTVSQEELADYASKIFQPARTTTRIVHVMPMTQGALLAAVVLLLWITFRLTGWVLTQPITMTELRYVARFRIPFLLAVTRYAVAGALGLGLARILALGFEWATFRWIQPLDLFWSQAGAYAGMGLVSVVLGLVYLSRIPRKLLIFPDHIRIKSAAFRARMLVPEDVAEISSLRLPRVWSKRNIFRTSLMSFGIVRPGIYLRPHRGRAYYFRSRDSDELLAMLQAWWGGRGANPVAPVTPDRSNPTDTPPSTPPEEPFDIDFPDIDDPELDVRQVRPV